MTRRVLTETQIGRLFSIVHDRHKELTWSQAVDVLHSLTVARLALRAMLDLSGDLATHDRGDGMPLGDKANAWARLDAGHAALGEKEEP